jgi:hypothetical protein
MHEVIFMQYKPDELFKDCRRSAAQQVSGFEQNNDRYCHIPDCSIEDVLSGTNSADISYEGGIATTGQTHANADESADRAAKKAQRSAEEQTDTDEEEKLRRCPPPRFYQ